MFINEDSENRNKLFNSLDVELKEKFPGEQRGFPFLVGNMPGSQNKLCVIYSTELYNEVSQEVYSYLRELCIRYGYVVDEIKELSPSGYKYRYRFSEKDQMK